MTPAEITRRAYLLKTIQELNDSSNECMLAIAELDAYRAEDVLVAAEALIAELEMMGWGTTSDYPLPGSYDRFAEAVRLARQPLIS